MPLKNAMIDSEDDFDFESDDGSDFDFDEENIPPKVNSKPKAKATTKKNTTKKTTTKKETTKAVTKKKPKEPEPISSDDDDFNDQSDCEMEDSTPNGKTVEQIYQKKDSA